MANFMLKFPYFRYHGNKGRSGINFNNRVVLPNLENVLFGARFSTIFLIEVEMKPILCLITIIWLPWQQGSVWSKFHSHCSIAWPQKPHVWCKILDYISYIRRVIANFVFKFPHFCYCGDKGQCGVNFNDTVKLHDLENLLVGAKFSAISLIRAKL